MKKNKGNYDAQECREENFGFPFMLNFRKRCHRILLEKRIPATKFLGRKERKEVMQKKLLQLEKLAN